MTWEELKKYLPACLKQTESNSELATKIKQLEKQVDFYKRVIERTDRIEKCLNQEGQIKRLQEQLLIATNALREYTIDNWAYEDEYNNYPLGSGGWCHAEEALKEIDLVRVSEKEVK